MVHSGFHFLYNWIVRKTKLILHDSVQFISLPQQKYQSNIILKLDYNHWPSLQQLNLTSNMADPEIFMTEAI